LYGVGQQEQHHQVKHRHLADLALTGQSQADQDDQVNGRRAQ
jgi:hypothetical protein